MKQRIAKSTMHFKGAAARSLLCAMMTDAQLLENKDRGALAPEMREAILGELARRGLLPGDFQI